MKVEDDELNDHVSSLARKLLEEEEEEKEKEEEERPKGGTHNMINARYHNGLAPSEAAEDEGEDESDLINDDDESDHLPSYEESPRRFKVSPPSSRLPIRLSTGTWIQQQEQQQRRRTQQIMAERLQHHQQQQQRHRNHERDEDDNHQNDGNNGQKLVSHDDETEAIEDGDDDNIDIDVNGMSDTDPVDSEELEDEDEEEENQDIDNDEVADVSLPTRPSAGINGHPHSNAESSANVSSMDLQQQILRKVKITSKDHFMIRR